MALKPHGSTFKTTSCSTLHLEGREYSESREAGCTSSKDNPLRQSGKFFSPSYDNLHDTVFLHGPFIEMKKRAIFQGLAETIIDATKS